MFNFKYTSPSYWMFGAPRSPKWRSVRNEHIKKFPYCAVCGCTTNLQAHHIQPYHLFPELELDPNNLITLGIKCRSGNHHYLFGHYQDWHNYNIYVRSDSLDFYNGITK